MKRIRSVNEGQVGRDYIEVGSFPDGERIRIPLLIARGERPGPILWMSASMHGPELAGLAVIQRLLTEPDGMDLSQLEGTIVAAPALNPLGIRNLRYYNFEDGENLSGCFPGDAEGGLTSRTGAAIWEVVSQADFVVDLHTNPDQALKFSAVDLCGPRETQEMALGMAEAFGVTVTVHPEPGGGMLASCMRRGIPSLLVELTPWWRIDPASTETGVRGMLNVLRFLKMLAGPGEKLAGEKVLSGRYVRRLYTASEGGYGFPLKDPGDAVAAGEVFLVLRSPFGDVVQEFAAPEPGFVLAYPWLSQAVPTGDLVAFTVHQFD
ncbi:MAG: succinylglutamate desuccinylase/aspartoacylase family protein [Bacillota bacterium]